MNSQYVQFQRELRHQCKMATFYSGRIMPCKTLINWNNKLGFYGRTGIRLTNSTASISKGAKLLLRPEVIEEKISDRKRFDSVLPQFVSCATRYNDDRLKPAMDHFRSVIEHTVPYGQKVRGLLTLAGYRLLTNQPTEEQLLKACIMGWCVEMLQAFILISDDIADNSMTRRGRVCWHRLENVGITNAVFDLSMVENGVYKLLRTFFGQEHYYHNVVEIFHDVTFSTMIGQNMDNWFCRQNIDIDQYNQDNFDTVCHYKTAIYTFYFPLALVMQMVEIPNKDITEEILKICLQLGQIYQAKNDNKDCFGDPNMSGKIGNDIEEGKCTWFIVNALKLANKEERNLLKNCYGKGDPELTKLVYNKYVELQLDRLYVKYEEETYEAIENAIQQLPPNLTTLLLHFLDTVKQSI